MWRKLDSLYLLEKAYFRGKLTEVKEGAGKLLYNTIAASTTTNSGPNADDSKHLSLIFCVGSKLRIKQQGHLAKQDILIANVWQTVTTKIGMLPPDNFQVGLSKGVVTELM